MFAPECRLVIDPKSLIPWDVKASEKSRLKPEEVWFFHMGSKYRKDQELHCYRSDGPVSEEPSDGWQRTTDDEVWEPCHGWRLPIGSPPSGSESQPCHFLGLWS